MFKLLSNLISVHLGRMCIHAKFIGLEPEPPYFHKQSHRSRWVHLHEQGAVISCCPEGVFYTETYPLILIDCGSPRTKKLEAVK